MSGDELVQTILKTVCEEIGEIVKKIMEEESVSADGE